MTKIDMKYTSLFWKLGFIEESTDQYHKVYSNVYRIDIEAEQQEIDYNFNTKLDYSPPTHLYEHKDFVVLECVNRLLEKGYSREDLLIIGDASQYQIPDVIVIDKTGKNLIAFDCKQWGKSFDEEYLNFKSGQGILFSYFQAHSETAFLCLYTSRLDGGLLEYKNAIIPTSSIENNLGLYFAGIFEDEFTPFVPIVSFSEQERQDSFKQMDKEATQIEDIQDYRIQERCLVKISRK